MKILRKILNFVPLISVGLTLLFYFLTCCFSLGKVIWYRALDCSGYSCIDVRTGGSVFNLYVEEQYPGVIAIKIFGFLCFAALVAMLVFSILNIVLKNNKTPWLLIITIMSFATMHLLVIAPAILSDIPTTDFGDVWEGFNWASFVFSIFIWPQTLALFILDKVLFNRFLNK